MIAKKLKHITNEFYTNHVRESAKEAVRYAPVDSGNLRGSISVSNRPEPGDKGPKSESEVITKIESKRFTIETEAYVNSGASYSLHLEMGTSENRPQPFMRLSAENTVNIMERIKK